MSHISKIRTQMTCREDIRSALKALGHAFQETSGPAGKTTFRVYVQNFHAIAITETKDGSFEVAAYFDELPAGMTRESFLGALLQRYAYHASRRKLLAEGFELKAERAEKGTIRLVATRRVLKERIEEQEMETSISKAGDVTIAVRGVKGRGCLDASRPVEEALGEVTQRELTLEGYFGDLEKREPDYVKVALIPPKEKAKLYMKAELDS